MPNNYNIESQFHKGNCALVITESGVLSNTQLSASLMAIKRMIKQTGIISMKIFPNLPVTKRPAEQPLGKGKSNVFLWVTPVKPGTIVFELKIPFLIEGKKALKAASLKLPIKSKIVFKN